MSGRGTLPHQGVNIRIEIPTIKIPVGYLYINRIVIIPEIASSLLVAIGRSLLYQFSQVDSRIHQGFGGHFFSVKDKILS